MKKRSVKSLLILVTSVASQLALGGTAIKNLSSDETKFLMEEAESNCSSLYQLSTMDLTPVENAKLSMVLDYLNKRKELLKAQYGSEVSIQLNEDVLDSIKETLSLDVTADGEAPNTLDSLYYVEDDESKELLPKKTWGRQHIRKYVPKKTWGRQDIKKYVPMKTWGRQDIKKYAPMKTWGRQNLMMGRETLNQIEDVLRSDLEIR
jgi:hypothetical protein